MSHTSLWFPVVKKDPLFLLFQHFYIYKMARRPPSTSDYCYSIIHYILHYASFSPYTDIMCPCLWQYTLTFCLAYLAKLIRWQQILSKFLPTLCCCSCLLSDGVTYLSLLLYLPSWFICHYSVATAALLNFGTNSKNRPKKFYEIINVSIERAICCKTIFYVYSNFLFVRIPKKCRIYNYKSIEISEKVAPIKSYWPAIVRALSVVLGLIN
jgi:hypothetical protein